MARSPSPSARSARIASSPALLGLIVAGGAAVRFAQIDFGLPHAGCRPDEMTLIAKVMDFFSGDLNPHFFSYPSLLPYALFGIYNLYYLTGLATGRFRSLADLIAEYATDPSNLILMSRGLSAILGTLSILAVYRLADRLFTRRVALISACFLAFAYLHVRDSHFGTTDVAVTFLVILSMGYIAAAYETGASRDYLRTGVFAGLATSTKYMGVLLGVPMILAHFLKSGSPRLKLRYLLDRKIVLFGLAFVLAFVVGTPFALIERDLIRHDFAREVRAVWMKREDLQLGWIYHLSTSLRYGLGLPLLLASLAGCFVLLRSNLKKAVLLLTFPILYYALMGGGYRDFVRYAIPMVPFLCITAAAFLEYLRSVVSGRFPLRREGLLLGVLTFLVLLPSLVSIARFEALLSNGDTRVDARRYIEKRIPAGSSICQFPVGFGYLELYPTTEALQKKLRSGGSAAIQRLYDSGRLDHVRAGRAPGYEMWELDLRSKKFVLDGEERRGAPQYVIVEESPLRFYNATVPAEMREKLNREYALLAAFLAFKRVPKGTVFNQLDAFYVPYAGFGSFRKAGPNILIYEKTSVEKGLGGGLR